MAELKSWCIGTSSCLRDFWIFLISSSYYSFLIKFTLATVALTPYFNLRSNTLYPESDSAFGSIEALT